MAFRSRYVRMYLQWVCSGRVIWATATGVGAGGWVGRQVTDIIRNATREREREKDRERERETHTHTFSAGGISQTL